MMRMLWPTKATSLLCLLTLGACTDEVVDPPPPTRADSITAILRALATAEEASRPMVEAVKGTELLYSLRYLGRSMTLQGQTLAETDGVTFAYDTLFHTYAPDSSRPDAPSQGVRYLLYATVYGTFPTVRQTVRPLVEIGWVDMAERVENGDTLVSVSLFDETGQPQALATSSGFDTGPSPYGDSSQYHGSVTLPAEGSILLDFGRLRRGRVFGTILKQDEYDVTDSQRGIRLAFSKTTTGAALDSDSRGTVRLTAPIPERGPNPTLIEVTFDQYACGPYHEVVQIDGDTVASRVGQSGAFIVLGDTVTSDTLWTFVSSLTHCLGLEAAFQATTEAVVAPVTVAYRASVTPVGNLEVQVATAGSPPDPDGYVVAVTEGGSRYRWARVGDQQPFVFSGLATGTQAVEILGVARHCAAAGESPRQASITAEAVTTVAFAVQCGSTNLRGDTLVYQAQVADGSLELFVTGADGADHRQVTSSANVLEEENYNTGQTTWAPDGSRLTFVSLKDSTREVYLVGLDGAVPRNLTNHPAHDMYPSWSPDGTRIAFASNRDHSPSAPSGNDLYVTSADGTSTVRITARDAPLWGVAWSPDGTRIAFVARDDGASGNLYVVDPGARSVADLGTSVVKLTHFTSGGPQGPLAWSPDGSRLAFSGRDPTSPTLTYGVYLVGADGTGLVRLADGGGPDLSTLNWSPSGGEILFDAPQGAYVSSADGSIMRLLDGARAPAWSANGALIAFSRDQEIYVTAADGSWTNRLTRPPGNEFYPRAKWRPLWKP